MEINKNNSGYTIVELLVAATIAAVVIIFVIAVVRLGAEVEVNDNNRRFARAYIASWFEDSCKAKDYSYVSVYDQEPKKIILNPRGGNPLMADFTINIKDNVVATINQSETSVDAVPIYQAHLMVNWVEVGEVSDTIEMTKWITNTGWSR